MTDGGNTGMEDTQSGSRTYGGHDVTTLAPRAVPAMGSSGRFHPQLLGLGGTPVWTGPPEQSQAAAYAAATLHLVTLLREALLDATGRSPRTRLALGGYGPSSRPGDGAEPVAWPDGLPVHLRHELEGAVRFLASAYRQGDVDGFSRGREAGQRVRRLAATPEAQAQILDDAASVAASRFPGARYGGTAVHAIISGLATEIRNKEADNRLAAGEGQDPLA